MKLLPKLKLSAKSARRVYPRLLIMSSWFVDLDSEGSSLDSRVIEYSFVISKLMRERRAKVLDVGCSDSANLIPLILASLGSEVHGIDNREFKLEHPNFHFTQGDIRNAPFANDFFDCVYAVSTIEHIGLKGRYGSVKSDPEGDIEAVREIERITRPGGSLLVTVPYGIAQVVKPLQRVYDRAGLQKTFPNWTTREELYYLLRDGFWETVPEGVAALANFRKGDRALALLELVSSKPNLDGSEEKSHDRHTL